MLSSLHIENIAVVKNADIDFINGFNVMTGETGAGKSVIIGSINLLRGQRFGKEIIRTGEERAMVSALFTDLSEELLALFSELGIYIDESREILLQRAVSADGKSSAKINGRTVNAALLRDVSSFLITIHGQHDNQLLMDPNVGIHMIDKYALLGDILTEYKALYSKLCDVRAKIRSISKDESERIRMIEMLSYQVSEIEAAKLKDGEEEMLEDKKIKIKNLERISKQLSFAYRALKGNEKGNVSYIIERTVSALSQIEDVLPEVRKANELLESVIPVVEDASEIVYSLQEDDIDDPTATLDKIESRLDTIEKLRKKYGRSISEIIEYKNKAKEELDTLQNSDNEILKLEAEERKILKEITLIANNLHEKRALFAKELALKIQENLEFLDMPKVKFKISVEKQLENHNYLFSPFGIDKIEFLVSANVGEPEMPISKIASGGEMARIMLAIKSVMADKDSIDTLIFDEVDAGVSGKTARKIGIRLLNASRSAQVICVTHSAQIASLSDKHLLISKTEENDRIYTKIGELDKEGSISELARILGGIDITEKQREVAKELIEEKAIYLGA